MPPKYKQTKPKSAKHTSVTEQESDCDSDTDLQTGENKGALASLKESIDKLREDVKGIKYTLEQMPLESVYERLEKLENKITDFESEMQALHRDNKSLQQRIIDIDGQSRRSNLILDGIPEASPAEKETFNDCIKKVQDVFTKMGVSEPQQIRFERCHHLGPAQRPTPPGATPPKPRPIIFKFHYFGDRQRVWSAKKELKETDFFIREDFPKEVVERRRQLLPIQKAAVSQGHESYLIVDKLHIKYSQGGHAV